LPPRTIARRGDPGEGGAIRTIAAVATALPGPGHCFAYSVALVTVSSVTRLLTERSQFVLGETGNAKSPRVRNVSEPFGPAEMRCDHVCNHFEQDCSDRHPRPEIGEYPLDSSPDEAFWGPAASTLPVPLFRKYLIQKELAALTGVEWVKYRFSRVQFSLSHFVSVQSVRRTTHIIRSNLRWCDRCVIVSVFSHGQSSSEVD
jgi:hypothetical protein